MGEKIITTGYTLYFHFYIRFIDSFNTFAFTSARIIHRMFAAGVTQSCILEVHGSNLDKAKAKITPNMVRPPTIYLSTDHP
jgi:hypothetical protein